MNILKVLMLSLLFAPSMYAGETICLTNGEYPPFTSEKLKHFGMFSHIVTKSFELAGIETQYQFRNWNASYEVAKEGRCDGSVAWAPTPQRKKEFYFSDPVSINKKGFFHLKSYPFNWQTMKDLKGRVIGATKGYTYGKAFDNAVANGLIKVQYVNKDIFNIRKLLAGRIDIFPMDIEVCYNLMNAELKHDQIQLITNHPQPVLETPLCVIISKKINPKRAKRLIASFNRGLKIIKENGTYKKIMQDSRQGQYKIK